MQEFGRAEVILEGSGQLDEAQEVVDVRMETADLTWAWESQGLMAEGAVRTYIYFQKEDGTVEGEGVEIPFHALVVPAASGPQDLRVRLASLQEEHHFNPEDRSFSQTIRLELVAESLAPAEAPEPALSPEAAVDGAGAADSLGLPMVEEEEPSPGTQPEPEPETRPAPDLEPEAGVEALPLEPEPGAGLEAPPLREPKAEAGIEAPPLLEPEPVQEGQARPGPAAEPEPAYQGAGLAASGGPGLGSAPEPGFSGPSPDDSILVWKPFPEE